MSAVLIPQVLALLVLASLAVGRRLPASFYAVGGWALLGLQAVSGLGSALAGPGGVGLPLAGWEFGFRTDGPAHVFLLTVNAVGVAVLRFSVRYLEGDPQRPAFLRRLAHVLLAVHVMALAPSLAQFAVGSLLLGFPLTGLLLHFPERAAARRSAAIFQVANRLGDAALVAAALGVQGVLGSTRWDRLSELGDSGVWCSSEVAACLIAFTAICKAAQIPFHLWLPDTLETPTPVSALLHAGVVNAGGFLLVRSSDLLSVAPFASGALILVGAATAFFGATVMLTQTSIKASLAYSTVAQMGFMILQCGFGAYSLALLHIAAHAAYKAHAFLHSGGALAKPPRRAIVLPWRSVAGGLCVSLAMLLPLYIWYPSLQAEPGVQVWLTVLLGACAYSVARHDAARPGRGLWQGSWRAALAIALTIGLHAVFLKIAPFAEAPVLPGWVAWTASAVFALLLTFQFLLARLSARPLWQNLYVHASRGFYLHDLLAHRFLAQRTSSHAH